MEEAKRKREADKEIEALKNPKRSRENVTEPSAGAPEANDARIEDQCPVVDAIADSLDRPANDEAATDQARGSVEPNEDQAGTHHGSETAPAGSPEFAQRGSAEAEAPTLAGPTEAVMAGVAADAGQPETLRSAKEAVGQPEANPAVAAGAGGGDGSGDAPPLPSKQYTDVKEDLSNRIEAAPSEIPTPAWSGFADHLGEGIKTRLLALATLHLTKAGAAKCPDAVRQLQANSNRVLLGAAPNCELYQERVIRALARQVGARILIADAAALHLDDLPPSSRAANAEEPGLADGAGSGGDSSDDDESMPPLISDDLMPGSGGGGRSKQTARKRSFNAGSGGFGDKLRGDIGRVNELAAAVIKEAEKAAELMKAKAKAQQPEEQKKGNGTAGAGNGKTADMEVGEPSGSKSGSGQEAAKEEAAAQLKKAENGTVGADGDAKDKAAEETQKQPSGELNDAGTEKPAAALTVDDAKALADAKTKSVQAELATLRGLTADIKTIGQQFRGNADRFIKVAQDLGIARPVGGSGGSRSGRMFARGGPGGAGGDEEGTNNTSTAAATWKKGDRVCYVGSNGGNGGSGSLGGEDRERLAMASFAAYMPTVDLREAAGYRLSLPGLLARRDAALSARRKASSAAAVGANGAAAAAGDDGNAAGNGNNNNPPIGAYGRVHSVLSDGRVEVVMDSAFNGAKSFQGQPENCGHVCNASELTAVDEREDAVAASFQALFDLIAVQATSDGPLVVFLPSMDRMLRSNNPEQFRRIKERLAVLPAHCLFVGGYTSRSLAKEKASSGHNGLSMLFGGGRGGDSLSVGGGDDFPPWYERFAGGRASRSRATAKGRAFAAMLPNNIELHPPHADSAAKAWKKMLEADVAAMREKSNRVALKKALARCDVVCPDLDEVKVTELALTKKEVEQVVGAAVANALVAEATEAVPTAAATAEPTAMESSPVQAERPPGAAVETKQPLTVAAIHITAAAASIQQLRAEAAPAPERHALKDISTDQYERQLLSEVVPPEEIAVGFDDIGALESVKNTLHEIVILPLQRPELFTRGALTRPTKGLLLFGPPGTGKTMLAKAVASESGAHFININMSAITSKWLGEGERLVRAVFSLAHKLAPSVIFLDEIDSFLAKRGGHSHEHEALRKMKTEFLAGWDGLRTNSTDRVLVLAATNRPMDLDDAAIRRMPRRIFVPLPDAGNRETILKVILKDEETDSKLDLAELGRDTDGYSGSDLKNLCIAAAYCPLRELLQAEKERKDRGEAVPVDLPPVRSISMADFRAAMKQVTPSTHAESATMSELQRWNDQYGEGGSRRTEPLNYYT